MSEHSSADRFARRRTGLGSLIVPGVFAAAAIAVLVYLGTWQVQRLEWKLGLMQTVEQRYDAPPVAAPGPDAWGALAEDDVNYLHVSLEGRFLPGETHVYTALDKPRGKFGGPGYWVVSPFETTDGWVVFVNRGFVPDPQKDAASRPGSAPPEGTVRLDGTIRRAEPAGTFTPAADATKNIYFVRDPVELAAANDIAPERVAPYTVDLRASHAREGGLPQPGETKITFNNPHLGYAITWYGLAVAAFGVFVAFAISRLRGSQD